MSSCEEGGDCTEARSEEAVADVWPCRCITEAIVAEKCAAVSRAAAALACAAVDVCGTLAAVEPWTTAEMGGTGGAGVPGLDEERLHNPRPAMRREKGDAACGCGTVAVGVNCMGPRWLAPGCPDAVAVGRPGN